MYGNNDPGTANEYFCEHGGLDLVMEMVKTNGTAAGVKQASLYCISAVIEENGMLTLSMIMNVKFALLFFHLLGLGKYIP